MSRRSPVKANLILAALLIAASVFAYVYEFQKKGERERLAEAKTKLLSLDQGKEIQSLELVDKEKDIDTQFDCKDHCRLGDMTQSWEIIKPIIFMADASNVSTFLNSVMSSTVQETIPIQGDFEGMLKGYGLAKEKRDDRKIVFKMKSEAQPYTLYIGDTAAVGDGLYVYLAGPGEATPAVRIVPSYFRANMQRDLSYWRNKRLFEFATQEVEGLKLVNSSGTVELMKEGSRWYLQPGKRLADSEAVETYLAGISFMNAQNYVSDDQQKDRVKLGLPSKASAAIAVKLLKKPEVRFEVYDFRKGTEPKLYLTRFGKNFVVELDRTNADKFAKKQDAFRFRNLMAQSEIQSVRKIDLILQNKDRFSFELEGANWKPSSGKLDAFDPTSPSQALNKIAAARVSDFLKEKSVPSGNIEQSAWVLYDASGKQLRSFKIYGTGEKGDFYVKLPDGEIGKLERGSGAAVPSRTTDFQKVVATPKK